MSEFRLKLFSELSPLAQELLIEGEIEFEGGFERGDTPCRAYLEADIECDDQRWHARMLLCDIAAPAEGEDETDHIAEAAHDALDDAIELGVKGRSPFKNRMVQLRRTR